MGTGSEGDVEIERNEERQDKGKGARGEKRGPMFWDD